MVTGQEPRAGRSRSSWVIAAVLLAGAAGLWMTCSKGQESPRAQGSAAIEDAPAIGAPRGRPEVEIDPRRLQLAAIAGTVRDPQGRPVAGAEVCAAADSPRLGSAETWKPTCGPTGRDGRYRLEGLWAVRHTVSAGAPGFVPAFHRRGERAVAYDPVDLRPGTEAREVDITLQDGGVEIRGVVRDLSGGAIEGALVTSGGVFYGTGLARARSGPEGEFSLWVRPGSPSVWASAEGYAGGSETGVAPGHRFELFLTPESVLVGKVVRANDGTPVAGARVHDRYSNSTAAITDSNGEFRLEQLTPGVYKPTVEADDAYGVAAEQVVLGLGETSAPIVIEAHPAATVEGTIVVAGGASCERGSLWLRDAASGREGAAEVEVDGVVRIRGMLAGTYEVTVRCDGFVSAERYEPIKVDDRSLSGLRWDVARGQAIRGVVVSAKGEPAHGISVTARAKGEPGKPPRESGPAFVDSDARGRFELAGLLPGKYDLRVFTKGAPRAVPDRPIEVILPEGQDLEDIRVELQAAGEVRGEVRDVEGRPVSRAQVTLHSGGRAGQTVRTTDEGTFHLPEVRVGAYRVWAQRDGVKLRSPGSGDDDLQGVKIEVRADAVETVQLVVETAGGTIAGVVRDADGGVVSDAFVEAKRESEGAADAGMTRRWHGILQRPHLTDTEGRFSLEELSPGKYTVHAFRRGGGEATVEHVAPGAEVTLTIADTGRLAGTVALAGGGAPEEFTATVDDPATGFSRRAQFFRTGGTWSFAELPPGNYKLQVSAAAGTQTIEVSLGSGEERSGVRVELAPKVTLRGTVVDLEGNPVPDMAVRVSETDSIRIDPGKTPRTDAQGRFEIAGAPTGPVRILVAPPRGGATEYSQAMITTQVTGGPVVELAPIRVARKKLAPGEAMGDPGFALQLPRPGSDPQARKFVVASVRPGGPAEIAGLRAGDEIVSVDGEDVTGERRYLYPQLAEVPVGEVMKLGLSRGVTVILKTDAPP